MPKQLKFSHKILLAASLVVVVAFALFTLYNDYLQRNAIRANLQSYLDEMGVVTADNIANWLSGRLVLLESLAQTVARDNSTEQVEALVRQPSLSSTFAFSYLGRADGEFLVHPRFELPPGYDPRQRPWYKDAVAAGRTTLTEPYEDAATNELIITVATPAQAGGQTLGVIGGDLSLKVLVDIINSLDFNGMGHAFLVSADGKILVHPDKTKVNKTLSELYPQNTPSLTSRYAEASLDGNERILAFSPVQGLPSVKWYVGISVDRDKAFASLASFRTSAFVATAVAVLFIIALLGMLIRVLMRPLTDMGRAMANIAEGEGDLTRRLAVQSNDEFGQLAGAFNRFVERIHGSIREVSSATQQVHEVVNLVLAASNSSMANSGEQASRTNSVAAAINELGAAAQEIARNAADASQQASGARHQAED
uniref:methyl-accepting chemotaxis protein n=1 Tax=Stutzerimonas balearica TaxID=74829 RepID=UPI002897666B